MISNECPLLMTGDLQVLIQDKLLLRTAVKNPDGKRG